jgi:hypothetical protein
MAVNSFPETARPLCAFTALTDGTGEADVELRVVLLEDPLEPVHRVRGRLRFPDRVATVNCLMRLSRCRLPKAGVYLVTLFIDGEWLAQRSLLVTAREDVP